MSLALAFLLGQIIPQCDGHCVMNTSYVTNHHSSNVRVHDVDNNVNPDEEDEGTSADTQEAIIVDCQNSKDVSSQKAQKKKSRNVAKIVTTSSEEQKDDKDIKDSKSDDVIKDQESENEVNQRLAADHANHLAFLIAEDKGLVQRTL